MLVICFQSSVIDQLTCITRALKHTKCILWFSYLFFHYEMYLDLTNLPFWTYVYKQMHLSKYLVWLFWMRHKIHWLDNWGDLTVSTVNGLFTFFSAHPALRSNKSSLSRAYLNDETKVNICCSLNTLTGSHSRLWRDVLFLLLFGCLQLFYC